MASQPVGTRSFAAGFGMSERLAQNWGWLLLRGVLAVLFGILTWLMPGVALGSLVIVFAIYMLVDGVLAIISAVRAAKAHERWGWLILEGLFGLAAGAFALLIPGIAVLTFVILIAAWAIITGAALLVASFRLHMSHGRLLMAVAGVVSMVWGVLLLLAPIAGALVLTLWIGAYALVFGAMMVFLALRLRKQCDGVGDNGHETLAEDAA
ncbi:HdeD family acid-resistance protein [Novosphingobium sp. M1R2S20]|uniref:HdeD family acid-resistance protein n=1 Tax=Novosphingobium rhizovicinum TaxID=3228928 RepID=A0ABV3RC25_9SPHN